MKAEGIEKQIVRIFNGKMEEDVSEDLVREVPLSLYFNGEKLITIACTGINLQELAVGFLRSEGIIAALDDLKGVRVLEGAEPAVYITGVERQHPEPGVRTIGSSGSRGKRTGDVLPIAITRSKVAFGPKKILELMERLSHAATIHEATHGTHCSGLVDSSELIVTREDIGRHNTIDMLGGYMLLNGIESADKAVITSGRISSEIVAKVMRMGILAILSHSAATVKAVALCRDIGITLIGYVRGGTYRVYANGGV